MHAHMKRPSPALVVATVALFVALGGTASAVVTQRAVPLAKRAFLADNARKVQGQTPVQIAAAAATAALALSPAGPRPSSTARGLVTITKLYGVVPAGAPIFTLYGGCGFQQRVLGGGFSASAPILVLASYPESDDRWTVVVSNPSTATVFVTVSATCTR